MVIGISGEKKKKDEHVRLFAINKNEYGAKLAKEIYCYGKKLCENTKPSIRLYYDKAKWIYERRELKDVW